MKSKLNNHFNSWGWILEKLFRKKQNKNSYHPKGHIEAGIDITIRHVDDTTKSEFIFNNCRPDKYYPFGPDYRYEGKKVKDFIRWHKSASITTQVILEALQTLDSYNILLRADK